MTITKIQIRWNDIDMLGHVYNGQYQHFFDLGKSDFFTEVLHLPSDWILNGQGVLTAQTLNNYYSPTQISEPVEIQTVIEKLGTKSFTLFQRMINSDTGVLKADSRSVLVCYDTVAQASREIPEHWRTLLHLLL